MAKREEGLGLVRLILVWSSLSPVFILWAVRGVPSIPDSLWISICLALFFCPTFLLYLFLKYAQATRNEKTVKVEKSKDQREHLLTYLFAMLIPLFQGGLGTQRDIASLVVAFLLIIFLFWHMGLHYMNLLFAMFGYRIFSVEIAVGTTLGDRATHKVASCVVISRRHSLTEGEMITGYRLGGDVLVDKSTDD